MLIFYLQSFFFYFRGRLKWGSACIGDDYAIEEELISNSLMTLLYGKKQSWWIKKIKRKSCFMQVLQCIQTSTKMKIRLHFCVCS